MSALIELQSVSLQAGERNILSGIDLQLQPATITSLIGPNGAGKTSLVKVVLGLSTASSGTVRRQSGLRIGYMPQKLTLNTTLPLTVERFLRLADRRGEKLAWALERAEARHLSDHSMHKLSGGEVQRVLLARALLVKPQLLVLDEPAQGVDISGQLALYERISSLRDELHCAILVVSHDLHWVMAQTDAVICLNQHICCHGHPQTVSTDPAYLSLFGKQGEHTLAPYHHDHDHAHTIHGDVVEGEACQHD
ncbi:MAG: zinc transport system ATP-binding protein [Bermanella sp.]|jgi:zinc transport system ATP-binding protein